MLFIPDPKKSAHEIIFSEKKKKGNPSLSHDSLVTIYKSLIKPHLDYGDGCYI